MVWHQLSADATGYHSHCRCEHRALSAGALVGLKRGIFGRVPWVPLIYFNFIKQTMEESCWSHELSGCPDSEGRGKHFPVIKLKELIVIKLCCLWEICHFSEWAVRMKQECRCNEDPSCEGFHGPAQDRIGGRWFPAVFGVCLPPTTTTMLPLNQWVRGFINLLRGAGLLIRGGQALNRPFIYLFMSVTWGT